MVLSKKEEKQYSTKSKLSNSILRFYFQILSLKTSIVKACTKPYLLFRSSDDNFRKITEMFNYRSVKYQKVKHLQKYLYLSAYLEKKTIIFDIDETLVYATTNKNDLSVIDETIFIKVT